MKKLCLIPLLLLLGCSPNSTPPTSTHNTNAKKPTNTNTMNCTLAIWKGQKTVANPTDADIRAAVTALNDSEIGPRLLLTLKGGLTRIELSGTPRDGFGLDYREDPTHVYASKKTDLSAETVTKVLLAARNGFPRWKDLLEWEKLKM